MKTEKQSTIISKNFRRGFTALGVAFALMLGFFSFIYTDFVRAEPESEAAGQLSAPSGVQGGAFEVTSYELKAEVSKNHSYEVVEKINVNIPDQLQNIEFAIPSGNFRISDLTVENTAYESRTAAEDSRVRIVDPDKLSEGNHEYTISYRLREFEDQDDAKDMFYFNVLLPEWKQPIGRVSVSASFPEDFPFDDMQCYAGQFGVQDSTNKIHFRMSKAKRTVKVTGEKIPENYGITLKAQLPDGYWEDALNGSWALNVIFCAAAGAALILLILWLTGGRDPKVKKQIVTKPVQGVTPVELGYVFNSRVDMRDVLRLILDFAVKGYLQISEYEPKRYRLIRKEDPSGEEKLFRNAYGILFENVYKGRALEMDQIAERLMLIKRAITDDIAAGFASSGSSAFTPVSRTFRYIGAAVMGISLGLANAFSYSYNYLSVNYAESIPIALITAGAAMLLCREIDSRDSSSVSAGRMAELLSAAALAIPVIYTAARVYRNTEYAILSAVILVTAFISAFFLVIMRARGKENAELVSKIRSLRSFIYHPTPKELLANYLEDSNYYYEMLIYALAFGAEESWAISFLTLDVPEPEWYTDDIEGHAFSNLREMPTTIDYARDVRSFVRTFESGYSDRQRR